MLRFFASSICPWFQDNGSGENKTTFMVEIVAAIICFLSAMMPKRSAKKIVAIILLAMHVPVKNIVKYTGFKKSSVYALRRELWGTDARANLKGFVASQCTVRKGRGRKNPIKDIEQEIIDHIESCNYFTQAEIQKWIKDTHTISVSTKHLGSFLKSKGIRKLKCGSIPAKADPKTQAAFYQDILCPLMEKAQSGKGKLYFVDASHFVMGCDFIGAIYGKTRRFVKSLSGRSRYNVLGALDYVSKQVITVTDDEHITATSVCDLLRKIRSANKYKRIHMVLDNAKYQKCECVQKLAEQLNIHLVYLPTYSPNLNLIERLWRFVKAELRKSVWDDYKAFSGRIDEIIESTVGENKEKIDSLIGEKIQLYNEYLQIDDNTFCAPESKGKGAA